MSLILDLIFPRRCFSCHRQGFYLCNYCISKLKSGSVRYQNKPPVEARLSLFKYNSFLKNLIKDLKFDFVSDIAPDLSHLIATTLKRDFPNLLEYWQENHFTLVPVPLHPYRLNWRGFNQSEIIARSLASDLKLPYNNFCLKRSRLSSAQSSLASKSHRRKNVVSSFYLDKNTPVPSKIILFDDVITTGATIDSCSSVFSPKTQIWQLSLAG